MVVAEDSMAEKTKDSDRARQADQAKHQARHPHQENFLAQGGQVAVDIKAEIARLRSERAWAENDRHGSSLVKGDGINVALMMLKKGAKMQEHHTRAPITVQVIEGKINFVAKGKSQVATAGTLIALDRAIEHSVEAVEESALVLTVGGEQM
jgi:quercetin dioxygenase-like cupin family protein